MLNMVSVMRGHVQILRQKPDWRGCGQDLRSLALVVAMGNSLRNVTGSSQGAMSLSCISCKSSDDVGAGGNFGGVSHFGGVSRPRNEYRVRDEATVHIDGHMLPRMIQGRKSSTKILSTCLCSVIAQ